MSRGRGVLDFLAANPRLAFALEDDDSVIARIARARLAKYGFLTPSEIAEVLDAGSAELDAEHSRIYSAARLRKVT